MSVLLDEIKKLKHKCQKLQKENKELRQQLGNRSQTTHTVTVCGMCNPSMSHGREI